MNDKLRILISIWCRIGNDEQLRVLGSYESSYFDKGYIVFIHRWGEGE